MLTYTKIATVTVGSGGSASIDFTSIPQTFTDLVIKISARTAYAAVDDNLAMRFNTATTSYSLRALYGTGSAAGSFARSAPDRMDIGYASGSTATASTFGNIEVYIPGYTSSNYKSYSSDGVAETNATGVDMGLFAGLWSSTAAITDIKLIDYNSSNLAQYSTATLYGIGYQPKATGGSISSDGTYWYHAFTSTGLFTPSKNLQCDVLVVAGGGGGGYETGGGGGGGGYKVATGISRTALTNYSVVIGAGGAASSSGNGGNGNNSVFDTITTIGGGGGGAASTAGSSGGSGGGGGRGLYAGGSATSGQGYAGGTGGVAVNTYQAAGGGGGGASAVGANAQTSGSYLPGNGGDGLTNLISGNGSYYAGGGGGGRYLDNSTTGIGGNGGGGKAANYSGGVVAAVAGTPNTGGGGGAGMLTNSASPSAYNGAAGGSGVVIVRYKI